MSLSANFSRGFGRVSVRRVSSFGRVDFNMFFDRNNVTDRLNRKEWKVLSGTGATGRGAMRRSIRKAGKKYDASKHTGPPRYHERGFGSLKDGIFFQANLIRGSVVIGPNKLRTNVTPMSKESSAQLIDEGGTGTITSFRYNKPQRNGRQRPATMKTRRGRWRPRSFRQPARRPTADKMLELLQTVDL